MKIEFSHYPTFCHRAKKNLKSKGKGRLITCQADTWEGSGIALPIIVTDARRVFVGSATPRPLYPLKITSVTHFRGGWVSGLIWTEPQNLAPTGVRFQDPPACSIVTITTELSRPS